MVIKAMLGSLLLIASPPRSLDEARALLPDMKPWHQRGWTVLSDAPRPSVQQVQRTLERTRQEWDRFLRLMERPRSGPDRALLCLLFTDDAQYQQFARQHDDLSIDPAHVPGYFSPRNGWIVFLDPGEHLDLEAAWEQIDDYQREVDQARAAGAQVHEAMAQLESARQELAQSEVIRRMALTAHETVHQLVHLTEAFPHHRHWPAWLHEGLSSAFETADRRRPFGPDRDFANRREAFLERLDSGSVSSIPALLQVAELNHDDADQVAAAYIDGCALISWLARTRRGSLADFLDAIGSTDAQGLPLSASAAFASHIGNPEQLTRTWWADERRRR
ncbi:MAG: DUF1570 domain-containing protein [Phycisphaerales bacterium]|nr:DUF1570 domain-containing protein [Phycisphaerales bacterium]